MSWAVIHSLLQKHWNKWVIRSSMIWPPWHYERWANLGCGKPKQVHNVIIKWVKDKRNVGVLGQINNQMPILGLAHE